MTRLVLDTNEYISAFNFGGAARRLLRMAVEGDIEIAISEPIMDEVTRVLRQKFEWQGYDVQDAYQRMKKICRVVEPTETLNVITYDPPDNRILECAIAANADYIISEDKDLLRLGSFGNSQVIRASDFIKRERTR